MTVLGLRFYARAFSNCGKWGTLLIIVRGPLTVMASLGPLLLRSTSSRRTGSVIVAHGPSCSAACGIFPDQGSNPRPPHWQADSQPLHHQGSPLMGDFNTFIFKVIIYKYVLIAIFIIVFWLFAVLLSFFLLLLLSSLVI